MDLSNLMNPDEASALSLLLLTEGKDEELMARVHCVQFPSDAAECVRYAVRVLTSKDMQADVLTVFEFIRDDENCRQRYPEAVLQLTLPALNAVAQAIRPRAKVLEYLDGLVDAMQEEGAL